MDWSPITEVIFSPLMVKLYITVIGIVVIRLIFNVAHRSFAPRVTHSGMRYHFRKVLTFVSYVVVALFITIVFSDQIGSLTLVIGAIGAGVTFALQEVIISIAGWFAISFAGFFKIGDRVQLGTLKGDVIDIGILRTTLMELGEWVNGDQYSGRIVNVANSIVFRDSIYNYSADFPFLWDEITVPVKFGSDYALARTILQDVIAEIVGDYPQQARVTWKQMVKKYMIEEASVDPSVSMIFNDNWVEFTVRYVVDFKQRRSTKDRLFGRILKEFEKHPDRVGLASATFELVGASPFTVRMARPE